MIIQGHHSYVIICYYLSTLLSEVCGRQIEADADSGSRLYSGESVNLLVVIVGSTLIVICLAVFVFVLCGDCYNSEVSSENHPASSGGGGGDVKWGGGDGYIRGYGQVVNPNEQTSGSQYHFATSNTSASGFMGYSASSENQPSGIGTTYHPVADANVPPPPYTR